MLKLYGLTPLTGMDPLFVKKTNSNIVISLTTKPFDFDEMKAHLLSKMQETTKFKKNLVQVADKFYYKPDSDLALR